MRRLAVIVAGPWTGAFATAMLPAFMAAFAMSVFAVPVVGVVEQGALSGGQRLVERLQGRVRGLQGLDFERESFFFMVKALDEIQVRLWLGRRVEASALLLRDPVEDRLAPFREERPLLIGQVQFRLDKGQTRRMKGVGLRAGRFVMRRRIPMVLRRGARCGALIARRRGI